MRKLYHPVTQRSIDAVKDLERARIDPIKPKVFVGYPFIIAIMAVLQVMTVMYDNKNFLFFGFDVSAGWLILMPVMQYLFQIVAEVYGWQYARQIVWCNFIVNVLIFLIVLSFKYIPFTGINTDAVKAGYINILDDKIAPAFMMIFAMLISDLITSALMSWSKFYWNGRHVVIRVLTLHFISEIIIVSTTFISCPFTGYSMADTWLLARDSFIARTIVMIILLPIARMVIGWLQNRVEGVIVFDYKTGFAPFKIRINPEDSVQFNADGWQKIDSSQIDLKKVAQRFYDEDFRVKHDGINHQKNN
jgi:uncharacterized PurR-regulated membrane protein YhhQ (DUF165 family)